MAGYSGTPLARKLGITEGTRFSVVGAPPGFAIPDLPPKVVMSHDEADTVLVFCVDRSELARRLPEALHRIPASGSVWVAWPKRASGVPTDLSFAVVQEAGLSAGVVDTKVAAIDATWSGLRFMVRQGDRPTWRS